MKYLTAVRTPVQLAPTNSPPLDGERLGVGRLLRPLADYLGRNALAVTPTPDPSPQGGGEPAGA